MSLDDAAVSVSVILDSAIAQTDKLSHIFKVWLCFSSCECVAFGLGLGLGLALGLGLGLVVYFANVASEVTEVGRISVVMHVSD